MKDKLRELEDRRYRAMIAADLAALQALLADTLNYTHSNAASDTKASYLEGVKSGRWKYKKIERPVEDIQVYGACAVITGQTRMEAVIEGTERVLNSRFTNVWVQGDKGWQMVAWQSTPIPK